MAKPRGREGGRKSLSPDEPTVKLEILLPESLKTAITAYAQMRSSQLGREVTVSQLIRDAIPWIVSGMKPEDEVNRRQAHEAASAMQDEE